MPTTRRSTGTPRGRAAPAKRQSTLSFHSKVTKNVSYDTKKAVVSPAVSKVELPAEDTTHDAVDDVEPDTKGESEEETQEEVETPEKSEAELKAEKVTDAQINKYWKSIEKQRMAPRVHQQDVTQDEKILRYFDVSSHYGPCIGIDRRKRWQRAEHLGLNPPIEVLAVLLKEESRGNKGSETAHMDRIINSIVVGSVA